MGAGTEAGTETGTEAEVETPTDAEVETEVNEAKPGAEVEVRVDAGKQNIAAGVRVPIATGGPGATTIAGTIIDPTVASGAGPFLEKAVGARVPGTGASGAGIGSSGAGRCQALCCLRRNKARRHALKPQSMSTGTTGRRDWAGMGEGRPAETRWRTACSKDFR